MSARITKIKEVKLPNRTQTQALLYQVATSSLGLSSLGFFNSRTLTTLKMVEGVSFPFCSEKVLSFSIWLDVIPVPGM